MIHEDRVEAILRQFVDDPSEWTDETSLEEIRGWDSMVQINLMFALEQRLGVRFGGSEMFEFKTVGQLKRYAYANSDARSMRHTG